MTFETFESGFTPRARLVPFLALVVIANTTNREGTLIAGLEQLSLSC